MRLPGLLWNEAEFKDQTEEMAVRTGESKFVSAKTS